MIHRYECDDCGIEFRRTENPLAVSGHTGFVRCPSCGSEEVTEL